MLGILNVNKIFLFAICQEARLSLYLVWSHCFCSRKVTVWASSDFIKSGQQCLPLKWIGD